MRKPIDLQNDLFSTPIAALEFDLASRDEIPKLLIGLQEIYVNAELREPIIQILETAISADKNDGRPGMNVWQIFVLGTLRLNCNIDYDKLRELANEHRTLRLMLGHDDFDKKYSLQTIRDNFKLLTPEIMDQIDAVLIKHGHSLLGDEAIELAGSCDSVPVETDVHYPTDINLLWDAIRKIITLMALVCDNLGLTEWRQHKHNLKKIKKLFLKARNLKKSNSKDEAKRLEREKVIKDAYEAYIEVVTSFVERAKNCIQRVRDLGYGITTEAQLITVESFIVHAERQIAQIRRRVIEDENIPHSEKVFSIFEEHTEWIVKGKAGVTQELGLNVCILKDQFGFILHHQVMEKQSDKDVAVSMIEGAIAKFDNLKSCSFDRGFYSPKNKEDLKEILDRVVLPKKGKLSADDKIEEHSEEFRKARRKHSAVEASISALENHGLDRCPDHGIDGFKRYVAIAVTARNIQIIGNLLQQRRYKQQKKLRLAA